MALNLHYSKALQDFTINEKYRVRVRALEFIFSKHAYIFFLLARGFLNVSLFDVLFLGSVCLQGCWLSILAWLITLKGHSNLIKRFSYLSLKETWCMLWQIEAAGRNQEDVALFSCQIINTVQTGGEDGWAEPNPGLSCTSKTQDKSPHCACKCSLMAPVQF